MNSLFLIINLAPIIALLLLVLLLQAKESAAFVSSPQPASVLAERRQWRSQQYPYQFQHDCQRRHSLARSSSTTTSTALATALTLYGSQGSRSPLVNWAAYELGISLQMGDLAQNPHPFGQIPCLVDNSHGEDICVFESGAILLYLHSLVQMDNDDNDNSDKTKKQRHHQRQAEIQSWVCWANASLDPICFIETPDGKVYDTGLRNTQNRRIRQLNHILAERKFLVDDGHALTVADVAVASYLLYVVQFFPTIDLSHWPQIVRYMKDCAARKAYGKAFGSPIQAFVLEKLDQMGDAPPSNKKKKIMGMF